MTGMAVSNVLRPLAAGLAGHRQHKITLNVILHGLFVLDYRDDHIMMLTPCVGDHIYCAGNWKGDETYYLSTEEYVNVGVGEYEEYCDLYVLEGPAYEKREPRMSRDFNIVFSKQEIRSTYPNFTVADSKSKFLAKLPYPAEIRPLRILKGTAFLQGRDRKFVRANGMSLCQVLIFPDVNTEHLQLTGTCWKWKPNAPMPNEPPTANLHFWAEPPYRVHPDHGTMAANQVKELLCPLDFSVVADESPQIDRFVDIPGIRAYEEQGWAEWVSPGEGTRPVNCNTSILRH
jgi:hypothetical protein